MLGYGGIGGAASAIATGYIQLKMSTQAFARQLQSTGSYFASTMGRWATKAGNLAGLNFGKGFAKSARRAFNRVGSSLLSVASAAASTAIAGGLAFGGWGIKVAAEMEQAEIAMQTLVGSMEKGTAIFKEVKDYARETPFEFPELEESARALLAFNVPLEDTMRVLKMLGNISSVSKIPLKQLADLYGRGKTQHRFFAQDLRELANASVDIKSALSESLGIPIEEISELVRKGKLGFDEVDKAFRRMTSDGGRYFKGTEKMGRTMGGQFNKLRDTVRDVAEEVGKGLAPAIEALTQSLMVILPNLEAPVRAFAEMFTPERLFEWADTFGKFLGGLIDWLDLFYKTFKTAQAGIVAALAVSMRALAKTFRALAYMYQMVPGHNPWAASRMHADADTQDVVATEAERQAAAAMFAPGVMGEREAGTGRLKTSAETAWDHMGERGKSFSAWLNKGKDAYNAYKAEKSEPTKKETWMDKAWSHVKSFGNELWMQNKRPLNNQATALGLGLGAGAMKLLSHVLSPENVAKKEKQEDVLSAGFTSFEDLNRTIQNTLLEPKTDKKIEQNTRKSNELLGMLGDKLASILGATQNWTVFAK